MLPQRGVLHARHDRRAHALRRDSRDVRDRGVEVRGDAGERAVDDVRERDERGDREREDDDEIGESRVGVEAAKREDAGRVREARAEASQATQVRRVLARVSARVRAGGEPARIHDARPAGVNGSDMCVPAPLDSRLATNRCSRASTCTKYVHRSLGWVDTAAPFFRRRRRAARTLRARERASGTRTPRARWRERPSKSASPRARRDAAAAADDVARGNRGD
eukprot:30961-Pelagococcus_subviridis.AAC.2